MLTAGYQAGIGLWYQLHWRLPVPHRQLLKGKMPVSVGNIPDKKDSCYFYWRVSLCPGGALLFNVVCDTWVCTQSFAAWWCVVTVSRNTSCDRVPAELTMLFRGYHFYLKEWFTNRIWLFRLEYLPDIFLQMKRGCHLKENKWWFVWSVMTSSFQVRHCLRHMSTWGQSQWGSLSTRPSPDVTGTLKMTRRCPQRLCISARWVASSLPRN